MLEDVAQRFRVDSTSVQLVSVGRSGEETVTRCQKDVTMSYSNAIAQDQLLKFQSHVGAVSVIKTITA